ncbi:MAG TPA: hypothetical protein VGD22_09440 [Sphingobacteriaceae bacterium]
MQKLLCYFVALCLVSCSSSIKPEDLYGEWQYINILNVHNPAESTGEEEIAAQKPSILFTKNNDLVIMWGGKQFSHGKFRIDGKMIRYTENLPEGKTREFPFLVSELTEDKLVFETMESEATRVTAKKVN